MSCLHNSLYGLKEIPQAWYNHLSDYLLFIRFYASKVNTSLFILFVASDIIYLLVYVDDILLTKSNSTLIAKLILLPSLEFKLRDLISIHYFLGIEVKPTCVGVILTQHKYALDILHKTCMSSCKLVDIQISLFF